jgi:creatinine amidohydrolase/Fe(II)-dependent formamide hydrolase-like protein/7-cyano-7-deazaguanine synthase in queuosine biosynthesis
MQINAKNNSLDNLRVIDKLKIGPVLLEPNRLIAPYRLYSKDKLDKISLLYKYEEKVFHPASLGDQNLANLIAAQVAINYGLFCNEIIFYGSFDQQDKRFIKDMIENTSREIYVKKFLEPNPFLNNNVKNLPAQKQTQYTNAIVKFVSTNTTKKVSWELWHTYNKKHAVLSSGGKDSLLTYGLLDEIGKETHPIFINESGRHWYTALNAYRYFKKNISNTSRVWTNSDRVFNWMLRHLPFIREDYSKIRSDEYPIRLWTVAVFLFGALPILKKRGIGRLLIGDEYDTTIRRNFKGISHYDGLYDQSRYFDNTLSRYFMSKGWAIAQFSILRSLSELMIVKILAERYPSLQKYQVSCHATHISGNRVLPCGKCEKCRRIIGMLSAIEKDPINCGYRTKQIQECLEKLPRERIHQESAGYEQLLFMLKEKKILDLKTVFKERAEILKIRIDPQKSPFETIPVDLREMLYNIFLKHAKGVVHKSFNKWVEIDLNSESLIQKPYPFETSNKTENFHQNNKNIAESFVWGNLTWPEAERYLEKMDVAILPVGAIEQHGPHLPLDTDSFDADYLAKQVAAACSEPKPLVLPLIPYGVSYHHEGFKGTVSINNDTLSKIIYEIGISLARNGIKKIVIINGHGGNTPSLNFAAQMINRDAHIFVCVDSGDTSDVDIYKIVETPNDVHAGEFETSTSLAIRPHLVKASLAEKSIPEFSSRYLNFTSKRGISWYAYTERISNNGIMGDPSKATAEKGRRMWQIMISHLVTFVEDLKRMSLEEIHQRRY